jgi:uncharacterized membrane protein YagU involved in acid resistance
MAQPFTLPALVHQRLADGSAARRWIADLRGGPLLVAVILVASWQVTARSEDPNGVPLVGMLGVINGTGGDLLQYRVFSYYLAYGLEQLLGRHTPPFVEMRFVQCLLIFGLAYAYYARLGLTHRSALVGIGLIAGLASLSLGALGPSSFSLDRFTDVVFYLVAALLVMAGRELWVVPLMVPAVANRETSVFIPTLILAWHGPLTRLLADRRLRSPLVTAGAAWLVGAVVYLGIHAYYGPRPRIEESYWGPAMLLHSLGMPAQVAFFFAALNLLPVAALLSFERADPFLRRLFWLVVPLWFAICIWAARLGEGILYLAPMTLIIVPLVLQGLERRLGAPVPRLRG